VAVVTKMDLARAVQLDWQAVYNNIEAVRPGTLVLKPVAKIGEGMDEYLDFLKKHLNESRMAEVI